MSRGEKMGSWAKPIAVGFGVINGVLAIAAAYQWGEWKAVLCAFLAGWFIRSAGDGSLHREEE